MIKIGLLSDTHAWWDDRYVTYFSGCDEIWHAGDIGSETLALQLASIKPFRAVHGNIDGYPLRIQYPRVLRFKVEDVEVLITHIGGYPGRYAPEIREELFSNPPQLFIAGHSHILKALYDPKLQCMHLDFFQCCQNHLFIHRHAPSTTIYFFSTHCSDYITY